MQTYTFQRKGSDVRPSGSLPYAMEIYELQPVSEGIAPRWLNLELVERVPVNDNQVTLDGMELRLCGRRTASGQVRSGEYHLSPGTLVEVWRDANGLFVCARAADVDSVRLGQGARDATLRAALQEREQRLCAQAAAFNAALAIPFKWVPGVSEDDRERPDGASKRGETVDRVVHILLRESLHDGRLIRKTGDFLCRRSQRLGSGHGPGPRPEKGAQVTCKECLAFAKRWRS